MSKPNEITQALAAWSEINRLYGQCATAGRMMVLLGIRCLQLKASLPYGQFNQQMAEQCPDIHRMTLYRYMKAATNVMQGLGLSHDVLQSGALDQMVEALEQRGEPELLAAVDDLIHGKSGRQLVLMTKKDATPVDPSKEPENQAWCLNHFDTHPMGAEDEARWRMLAESGEWTWAECRQAILGRTRTENGRPAADIERLASSGFARLKTWCTQEHWSSLNATEREALLGKWDEALSGLAPELADRALHKLTETRPLPAKSKR